MLAETVAGFTSLGGVFVTPAPVIADRLGLADTLAFDWDGVFNNGSKGEGATSLFAEADSMGTNLLRFALWLKHGEMPFTCVVTGENNRSAVALARREHFNAVYSGMKDKTLAFAHMAGVFGRQPSRTVFLFDDVLDLAAAENCGLRFMIRQHASPLLAAFAIGRKLCDYLSAMPGGQHAVREVCELALGLMGVYDQTVAGRMAFSQQYQQYISERNASETRFFAMKDGEVREASETVGPHQA